MRGNGSMIRQTGMGNIYIPMELNTMVSGRMTSSMGMARSGGLMGLIMKGTMPMAKSMEKASYNSQMSLPTKGTLI